MLKKLNIGDEVALKPAILFGLETYIKAKMGENPDPEFHVGTVEWGRESFSDKEAQGTIISFIEPPKPVEIAVAPKNSAVRNYPWTVFIQGILKDSLGQPTFPAYELVAELKRVMFSLIPVNDANGRAVDNILNLGPSAQRQRNNNNNVHDLAIGAETVRGPGDQSRYTFFWLPVHFSITEDLKSPRVIIQNPL